MKQKLHCGYSMDWTQSLGVVFCGFHVLPMAPRSPVVFLGSNNLFAEHYPLDHACDIRIEVTWGTQHLFGCTRNALFFLEHATELCAIIIKEEKMSLRRLVQSLVHLGEVYIRAHRTKLDYNHQPNKTLTAICYLGLCPFLPPTHPPTHPAHHILSSSPVPCMTMLKWWHTLKDASMQPILFPYLPFLQHGQWIKSPCAAV
jgi:hypothetical protein